MDQSTASLRERRQIQLRRRTRVVKMAGDALEDLQLAQGNGQHGGIYTISIAYG